MPDEKDRQISDRPATATFPISIWYPVSPNGKAILITTLALIMSAFHLYTGGMGSYIYMIQRGVHLSLVLALIFFVFPLRKSGEEKGISLVDLVLGLTALIPGVYLVLFQEDIFDRASMLTEFEIVMGLAVVVLLLEAVRRAIGLPLMLIAAGALLYIYLGPHLPGILGHRGYSLERVSFQMFYSESGIMGTPLGVCSTIIALFILFGSFLEQSGGTGFFIDAAMNMTRGAYGGPAKAAVVASGLMGTISGSAVANVVTTGTFTIPLMIKTGYKRSFAAAVEAVASSGGQLAPPIMGAAAFLMADMTGTPYSRIALAAVIPAVLFYTALYMAVHLEARRLDLRSNDEPAATKFRDGCHLFVPVILLIVLMTLEFSPTYVAFWTIIGMVAISWVNKATRLTPVRIFRALRAGALGMLTVSAACACAGIVVGAVTLTGLPLKFSSMLVGWAGGNLFLLLVLTMLTSLVIGMGLPTAPAYILLATLIGPALTNLGLPILAAHMFIFYFGVISAITPPVAVASYAAAGLAKTNPNTVGFTACRIGLVTFIVPYMFVYGPALLFIGDITTTLVAFCTALIGAACLAVATIGYWRKPCGIIERGIFCVGALLMLDAGHTTDWIGLALVVPCALFHISQSRREQTAS